jgi:transposase
MTKTEDTIGLVRDHRWMRSARQKECLAPISRVVIDLGDKRGKDGNGYRIDDLLPLIRPGTVVQLVYAFLLADPAKKSETGKPRRAAFDRAVSLIVEKRKGVVKDVLTGLSTETPAKRLAFRAAAHDQIARSNRGLHSAENGALSPGRPSQYGPAERQIIWEEWHSSLNRTNGAAADAAAKRMGRPISTNRMWNIVKEERAKRGVEGKGASGRRPNVKALEVASGSRKMRGVVYFLQNGRRKQVKIGFGVSLKDRVGTLRTSSPEELRVLAAIPGDRADEAELHKRFAKHHIRREWFRLDGELAEYVAGLPKPKR